MDLPYLGKVDEMGDIDIYTQSPPTTNNYNDDGVHLGLEDEDYDDGGLPHDDNTFDDHNFVTASYKKSKVTKPDKQNKSHEHESKDHSDDEDEEPDSTEHPVHKTKPIKHKPNKYFSKPKRKVNESHHEDDDDAGIDLEEYNIYLDGTEKPLDKEHIVTKSKSTSYDHGSKYFKSSKEGSKVTDEEYEGYEH